MVLNVLSTMRKKGSLLDITVIMFVFAALVMTGLTMSTILVNFTADESISRTFNITNNTAGQNAIRLSNRTTQSENGGIDNMIVTFFFLAHIAIIILAAIIPTSIIFIFVTIIFVMMNIVMGYIVNSLSAPLFAGFAVQLVMSKWLLDHIIAIELGYSILVVIVMFISGYRSQAGGGTG